jgi:hypothetical protein
MSSSARRSEAPLFVYSAAQNLVELALDWADEDIRPYAFRGASKLTS